MPGLTHGVRRIALGDWLEAADPGGLRRSHAARAALAALTAWLTARLVVGWLADRPMPAVGLFAVTVCFVHALVIVDARRAERRLTLLLSIVMAALALLLASLLSGSGWLYSAVLLVLIFASYAVRQRGLRPGELILVLTMSLYFAEGIGITWGSLAWFLFAVVTGVVSLWMWQFVLLPYDPTRSLRSSIRSFYHATAAAVDAVAAELENAPAPAEEAKIEKDLRRRLKQVKLSRRVIEGQFPGVLAPGGWTQAQIGQLQLALFNTEQGLAQLVEGVTNRSHLSSIPVEIRTSLGRSLRSLQEALVAANSESMQALAIENAALQTEVRAYASAVFGDERWDTDAPPAPWVAAAVRLVSGSVQVAQSAGQVQKLAARQGGAEQPSEPPAGANAKAPSNPALSPRMRLFGNWHVHPTTVLGIQAVIATGLAMVVARLLNVDHSNWVFWTAFVVIAGSTGESLRKMMMRVVGTVAGATIGVALALLTPDNTVFVVLVATGCIFLTIYAWPISYPQMVFWLNIGFVMVYTRLGAQELDLLFARPVTTLLGALVAALVVVYVFPIHTTDRFKAAVARFLGAVDGYVTAFVDAVTNGDATQPLGAAHAKVTATYAQVEQTLPGVAFENNPLLQAQSPLTQQATRIAALEAEIARLAQAASEHTNRTGDFGAVDWMRAVQTRIHRDIQAITPLLSGDTGQAPKVTPSEQAKSVQSWIAEQPQTGGGREGQLQSNGGLALIRINTIITQIAEDLGASVRAAQDPGVS